MEKKINIAELLKDCPQGMELDCTAYDNVSFDKISSDKKAIYPIYCYITDEKGNHSSISFTENGCESKRYGAKCVIFPKDKTTWDDFVPPCKFKDGDIVHVDCGGTYKYIVIFKQIKINGNVCVYGIYDIQDDSFHKHENLCDASNAEIRLATEEEKQKLFQAIKDKGYKWNAETKTLEKLIVPKFKVGDRVKYKNGKNIDGVEQGVILSITDVTYDVAVTNNMGIFVTIADQDNWELVPNKFDITTLKPFDSRVLVRHNKDNKWCGSFFSHIDEDFHSHCYKFVTTAGKSYPYCIPYEGNEHLLCTTDDCDNYYKTWK